MPIAKYFFISPKVKKRFRGFRFGARNQTKIELTSLVLSLTPICKPLSSVENSFSQLSGTDVSLLQFREISPHEWAVEQFAPWPRVAPTGPWGTNPRRIPAIPDDPKSWKFDLVWILNSFSFLRRSEWLFSLFPRLRCYREILRNSRIFVSNRRWKVLSFRR